LSTDIKASQRLTVFIEDRQTAYNKCSMPCGAMRESVTFPLHGSAGRKSGKAQFTSLPHTAYVHQTLVASFAAF
jgi:hypothetical protein